MALLKNLSMGCSITEAARKAGYSKKWPGQAGFQALQNLKVKMPGAQTKEPTTSPPPLQLRGEKPVSPDGRYVAFQAQTVMAANIGMIENVR